MRRMPAAISWNPKSCAKPLRRACGGSRPGLRAAAPPIIGGAAAESACDRACGAAAARASAAGAGRGGLRACAGRLRREAPPPRLARPPPSRRRSLPSRITPSFVPHCSGSPAIRHTIADRRDIADEHDIVAVPASADARMAGRSPTRRRSVCARATGIANDRGSRGRGDRQDAADGSPAPPCGRRC